MGVVKATPRPFYPRERPGTHFIGGWVGPWAGLDGCGNSRLHRDSISGPSVASRYTYLLTPWSRTPLEKLTGSAASQEIPRIFGTRRFLTVPTSARHLSLS